MADIRSRREGIRIHRRYGLVRCRCGQPFIVVCGQQTKQCPRCGRRSALARLPLLASSDEQAELRPLIARYAK